MSLLPEFDMSRAECILPARTSVFAYRDDCGDLWINVSDACYQCDAEFRINCDDVRDFIEGLIVLLWPHAHQGDVSAVRPAAEKPEPAKADPTAAKRQRKYRARKQRNDRNAPSPDRKVTPNDRNATVTHEAPGIAEGLFNIASPAVGAEPGEA